MNRKMCITILLFIIWLNIFLLKNQFKECCCRDLCITFIVESCLHSSCCCLCASGHRLLQCYFNALQRNKHVENKATRATGALYIHTDSLQESPCSRSNLPLMRLFCGVPKIKAPVWLEGVQAVIEKKAVSFFFYHSCLAKI